MEPLVLALRSLDSSRMRASGPIRSTELAAGRPLPEPQGELSKYRFGSISTGRVVDLDRRKQSANLSGDEADLRS
jgi:hypothetical protein